MPTHTTRTRRRRTATAVVGAAMFLSSLGMSSGVAGAGERTTAEPRDAVAAREHAPTIPTDLATPGGDTRPFTASELHALAVLLQHCLDQLDAGACSKPL